jgi:amino acid adenylation domain-containing protein
MRERGLAVEDGAPSAASLDFAVIATLEQPTAHPSLTRHQLAGWFAQQQVAATPAYSVPVVGELDQDMDFGAFADAFAMLVAASDSLRSVFRLVDGTPQRIVLPKPPAPVSFADFSDQSDPRAAADAWVRARAQEPLDLTQCVYDCVLIRLGPKACLWYLCLHHLIADVLSIAVIGAQMDHLYSAARRQQLPEQLDLPQFAEHLAAEHKYMAGEAFARDEAYWQAKLAQRHGPFALWGRPLRKTSSRVARRVVDLGAERSQEIIRLAAISPQVSPTGIGHRTVTQPHARPIAGDPQASPVRPRSATMLFASLLLAYVHRISGETELALGMFYHRRSSPRMRAAIGYFAGALPLHAEIAPADTVLHLCDRLGEESLRTLRHSRCSVANPWYNPTFEVSLNYQIPSLTTFQGKPLVVHHLFTGYGGESLALQVDDFHGRDSFVLSFDLHCDVFSPDQMDRVGAQFVRFLDQWLADPHTPIGEIDFLPSDERHRLLYEFNQAPSLTPAGTLPQRFEAQAARAPDQRALLWRAQVVTFHELNAQANRIAHLLLSHGGPGDRVVIRPGDHVGIALPRGPLMVAAILGVLKIGAVYVALDPAGPPERLKLMVDDADLRAVLTQEEQVAAFARLGTQLLVLDSNPDPLAGLPAENPPAADDPGAPAYVIYTSGSTGQPNGVVGHHRGIINCIDWMQRAYPFTAGELCVQKTHLGFIDSVEEIFGPLLHGVPLLLLDDETVRNPSRLAAELATHGVSRVVLVPSLLAVLLDVASDTLRAAHALRYWIVGGEALPPALAQRFLHLLPGRKLINIYGMSEAAADSTWHEVTAADFAADTAADTAAGGAAVVPIGRPIANTQVYVLDSQQRLVPQGMVGELYVGGANVASGYWNRPELTAGRFLPDPFSADPHARLFRTGDLVRWLPSGALEYLGRADEQVNLRGLRIELGEIEETLRLHPAISAACVLMLHDAPADRTAERLVAYLVGSELSRPTDTALRTFLARRLPEYMLPSAYVHLASLPLNDNGKLDRQALTALAPPHPDPMQPAPPQTELEATLVAIWQDVLGLPQVGILDNFFAAGGNSLTAMQVAARLQQTCGCELPIHHFFELPTIAELAAAIEQDAAFPAGDHLAPPTPAELVAAVDHADGGPRQAQPQPATTLQPPGRLPLSFEQERMWLLHVLQPESVAYNTHFTVRLRGTLNVPLFAQSIEKVVGRHSVLRANVCVGTDGPYQVIRSDGAAPLTIIDLTKTPADRQEAEARRLAARAVQQPFDLAHGPLLRATLLQLAPDDHIFQLTVHHFAADAWGLRVFAQELAAYYEAAIGGKPSPLADLLLQYTDYAQTQRERWQGERLENRLASWRQKLAGVPGLSLPANHPRPPVPTGRGGWRHLPAGGELLERVRRWSQGEGVTAFATMMAAFEVLLYRYTGQTDFAIGMPIANRMQAATEGLVGSFMNTAIQRADLSGNPTFRELLRRVHAAALDAYRDQDLPFEKLAADLQPARDAAYAPLFQVMCNGLNTPLRAIEFAELDWEFVTLDTAVAQVDLALSVMDTAYSQAVTLEYNADLFDGDQIERMLAQYAVLIAAVLENPERTLDELPILPPAEERRLLVEWNATAAAYPRAACVHHLFAAQAARTPTRMAVSTAQGSLTYAELEERATRLAAYLRTLGVAPGTLVGLCLDRSLDMVVALLGVLQAGGAYVPLDPSYPLDRLLYMLDDAAVAILLTTTDVQPALAARARAGHRQVIELDTLRLEPAPRDEGGLRDGTGLGDEEGFAVASRQEAAAEVTAEVTAEDLAYVIYTSGSTGSPKGVQIGHRGVVNFLLAMQRAPGIGADDVVLAVTTLSFDIAVLDLLLPLIAGARVVIASREQAADGLQLRGLLAAAGATVLQATPATWRMLLAAGWEGTCGLKALCGGEAMGPDLVEALLPRVGSLWNLYGPTETTVWATVHQVTAVEEPMPIGRPIANTQAYVLDAHLRPVPIGVPGELYLGGDGVAHGYLGKPELTAARFVPDPFAATPGARLYRTGDLVRYRRDGNLEFLGRLDHQVKVRGFRVELGEVEAVLNQHPAVGQAIVKPWDDGAGGKYLAAYIQPARSAAGVGAAGVGAAGVGAVGVGEAEVGAVGVSAAGLRGFAAARLPGYMVPTAYVVVEAFPLTPSGKIDRKQLPHPGDVEASARPPYTAPRTALEAQLVRTWETVLAHSPIGVHDNFFEVGGNSLAAAQMFLAIERQLGRQLPLATLFGAPTVAELAAILGQEGWIPTWTALTAIQPAGSKPPFFCVHGVGGDVVGYYALARELGPDQPVYGLRARGLDGQEAPQASLPEMAATYLAELRSVQPHGPYYLGGYCYGGVVAFEMAQQLVAAGEAVALVAILEGYAITRAEGRRGLRQGHALRSIVQNLPYWAQDHLGPGGPTARRLRRRLQEATTAGWGEAGAGVRPGAAQGPVVWRGLGAWKGLLQRGEARHRRVEAAHEEAINRYTLRPYPGRVVLFRVRTMPLLRAADPYLGWARFADAGVEVRIVPGAHYNILDRPHVGVLAAQLREYLAGGPARTVVAGGQ